MKCTWTEVISILPGWMRADVAHYGAESMRELRLRLDQPPELVMAQQSVWLCRKTSAEDLKFCLNSSCQYSPWTASSESEGYITICGGHRIGICGEAILKNGSLAGFRKISSLCIRIAHDYQNIWNEKETALGSILILGAPGWGKTTLLRDCVRKISEKANVAVIDERAELFPIGFFRGKKLDVLSGCPKTIGIEIVLRTMCPDYIAVDEITAAQDSAALVRAVGCGVQLVATAHAPSFSEFRRRPVYRPLLEYGLFDSVVQLHKDMSFSIERIGQ